MSLLETLLNTAATATGISKVDLLYVFGKGERKYLPRANICSMNLPPGSGPASLRRVRSRSCAVCTAPPPISPPWPWGP